MADDEWNLGKEIADILSEMLIGGMELPLHMAALAANGALLAGTYEPNGVGDGGLSFEIKADNANDDDGMPLPINMLFVDANGKATCICIERPGVRRLLN